MIGAQGAPIPEWAVEALAQIAEDPTAVREMEAKAWSELRIAGLITTFNSGDEMTALVKPKGREILDQHMDPDDLRNAKIAVAANRVGAALITLYEACDDDEVQVGEVMDEVHKGARLARQAEQENPDA